LARGSFSFLVDVANVGGGEITFVLFFHHAAAADLNDSRFSFERVLVLNSKDGCIIIHISGIIAVVSGTRAAVRVDDFYIGPLFTHLTAARAGAMAYLRPHHSEQSLLVYEPFQYSALNWLN
jgi:hypothetical protein